jgi:hypothetical protein
LIQSINRYQLAISIAFKISRLVLSRIQRSQCLNVSGDWLDVTFCFLVGWLFDGTEPVPATLTASSLVFIRFAKGGHPDRKRLSNVSGSKVGLLSCFLQRPLGTVG